MQRDLVAAAVGDDADRAVGEIPEQCCVRLFHVKDDRGVVGRFDMIDEFVDGRLGTADFSLQQRIEGPLHIAGCQRTAVVKLYATVQMKDVGQRIGDVPALGETGSDVQVISAREQIVEDQ